MNIKDILTEAPGAGLDEDFEDLQDDFMDPAAWKKLDDREKYKALIDASLLPKPYNSDVYRWINRQPGFAGRPQEPPYEIRNGRIDLNKIYQTARADYEDRKFGSDITRQEREHTLNLGAEGRAELVSKANELREMQRQRAREEAKEDSEIAYQRAETQAEREAIQEKLRQELKHELDVIDANHKNNMEAINANNTQELTKLDKEHAETSKERQHAAGESDKDRAERAREREAERQQAAGESDKDRAERARDQEAERQQAERPPTGGGAPPPRPSPRPPTGGGETERPPTGGGAPPPRPSPRPPTGGGGATPPKPPKPRPHLYSWNPDDISDVEVKPPRPPTPPTPPLGLPAPTTALPAPEKEVAEEHGAASDTDYQKKLAQVVAVQDNLRARRLPKSPVPPVAESDVDSDGHSVDHADSGEYDYEGDQAKDQLNTIVRAARRLNNILDDNENMPEWVQMKITSAADYIDTAADYIESNQAPSLDEATPKEKEADYGADYQDMVGRVKKLAGLGPLKTVWDPTKRVYRNVPTAQQPKK
jgi:hypothetical protein